jgi:hypothetical protein
LQSDVSDRWQWDSDIDGGYTVLGAYHLFTTQTEPLDVGLGDFVSHKQVPLKVSILAWRLLRDRLPTKNNLLRRGFLNAEAASVWQGEVLTNQHLACFFTVSFLVLCGSTSGLGLACQVLILIIFVIISFSLLTILVIIRRHVDLSFSLFFFFWLQC